MRALNHKLVRELWAMRSQALAIAMVIGSGVATFVMSLSTLDSLRQTRDAFYRDYNFADAFVSLERAPEGIGERIREIPGVGAVETRVNAAVKLDIEGYPDPATALSGRPSSSARSNPSRTVDPIRRARLSISG